MIKNFKMRLVVDQRGKITSGIKTERGLPKSVDYFDISKFPELMLEYGSHPNKILIAFPTDDIQSVFDDSFVLYSGNQTRIRSCDGENCIHRIDENIEGTFYKAGTVSDCICDTIEDEKKKCKYTMYLKAWVLNKEGKLLSDKFYLFRTGSHNSGENIRSELEKTKFLTNGVLINIPFGLSVKMVGGKENVKTKFPIWTLTALPSKNLLDFALPLPESKALMNKSDGDFEKYFSDCNTPVEVDIKYSELKPEFKGKNSVAYKEAEARKEFLMTLT